MTDRRNPNGRPSVNVYTSDLESDITRYGKHNRIIVLGDPEGRNVIAREDDIGLRSPTETEQRRVLMGWQRQHPRGTRLRYAGSETYACDGGASVDHTYVVERGGGE